MTSNIFVTKLPREITDNDLMTIFSEYKPVSAKVMLDASTGKSKGFGFVLFPSVEAGEAALSNLNGAIATVQRRNFHLVMQASKHDGRISCTESNALYVRNIPMTASREDIQYLLSMGGTLVYSVMRQDNYGSPVWVVYAEYDCVTCAKQSLQMLHGNNTFFGPSSLPILAKFADSSEIKEDRRRRRVDPQMTDVHTAQHRATSPASNSPPDSLTNSPRVYRHNPYSTAIVESVSTARMSPVTTSERKVCPRIGPWIPITETIA